MIMHAYILQKIKLVQVIQVIALLFSKGLILLVCFELYP